MILSLHTCAYFFFDLKQLLPIKGKKSKDCFLFIENEVISKLSQYIFKNEGKDNRFKCQIMKREAAIMKMQKKNT